MGKSIEVAKALLEEMASNNYHWSSKRVAPKRPVGSMGWTLWTCWLARLMPWYGASTSLKLVLKGV